MAAPSSLPSENEKKEHPYQVFITPGPNGAYEARQVTGSGLYVRVDMPGVPPDGVKLVKYGETRTVTFSGKAPKEWSAYDSSGRVYGGYVVLDRDPNEVEVEMSVKNGCMRLVFPGSDGTLHFLSGLKRAPNVEYCGEDDDSVVYAQDDGSGTRLSDSTVSATVAFSHINPFLIQGVEGVHENRVLKEGTGDEFMYLRMDMPGLAENLYTLKQNPLVPENTGIVYGGTGEKEHPFDQGGRAYYSGFVLHCGCCHVAGVKHLMRHGVARAIVRKCKIQELKSAQTRHSAGTSSRGRRRR